MRVLFLFLDGIGLGNPDPALNPFAKADMPHLKSLLNGHSLTAETSLPLVTSEATLTTLDASLGVQGLPQSATGQATLLTGTNVPATIGYHYGPKPNKEIAACLNNGNLFSTLEKAGLKTALLNAYPPRYFDGINSGHRLPGAIAMAAYQAKIHLMTAEDLYHGNAISADLTAIGWREHLGYHDAPLLSPTQAGTRLAELSKQYSFSLFEYWLTDVAGHNQDMEAACYLLRTIDQVLGGLKASWDDDGLTMLVSDHGNLEDLSTRRHTMNPVPLLLIGTNEIRKRFFDKMKEGFASGGDLTSIYKAILHLLTPNSLI